jgi:heptaprenyl diphosphate synthase
MNQFQLPQPQAADMQQIERIMLERLNSQPAAASVAGSRLAVGRGRLRAALVLLGAGLLGNSSSNVAHAAAAVELIYAATSTHHDLVDGAERRRDAPPSAEPWPHGVTLMVGDYLFALAAGEMALAPDPRVIGYYSQAVADIAEAGLAPVRSLAPLALAREQHQATYGGKVAALFAAAGRAGMACGGGSPTQIEALGRYGAALGLAGQMAAEALDIEARGANTLRQGLISLPLIYAATREDPDRLLAALDSKSAGELAWALAAAQRHGLGPARSEAAGRVAVARAQLLAFPPSDARAALDALCGFVLAHGV